MVESEQPEQAEETLFSVERLTFFSDAVVAIAMTLLALELPVPGADARLPVSNHQLLQDVVSYPARDTYLAFLISFVVIARSWTGHHQLFGYVRTLAPGLMRWNLLWLLMIVITPFATKVLTRNGAFETRFILYAAVQALSGIFFALMVRSIARGGVLKEAAPPDLVPSSCWRLLGFAAAFLISIPVALVTHWAYVCWATIPFLSSLARRIWQSRPGHQQPAEDPTIKT